MKNTIPELIVYEKILYRMLYSIQDPVMCLILYRMGISNLILQRILYENPIPYVILYMKSHNNYIPDAKSCTNPIFYMKSHNNLICILNPVLTLYLI